MQKKLITALTLGALLALGSGGAFALGESHGLTAAPPTAEAEAGSAEEHSVTFAGMRIAIDPETGRMRPPTEAEAAQLAAAMRKMLSARPAPAQQPVPRQFGATQGFVLDASYLRFAVARTGADGSTAAACIETPEQAERFLAAPALSNIDRGLE